MARRLLRNIPQEGIPGDARYWLYLSDGDRGWRVGWTTSNARAREWLRRVNEGGDAWVFDRTRRVHAFCKIERGETRATWWELYR